MGPAGRPGEEWFTELYASHYGKIVKYGLRRLADAGAAADLAQEVFTVAWRRRTEVPAAELPWLYAVARRLLANHRRRHWAVPVADPETLTAGPPVDDDKAAAAYDVRVALTALSDIDREILQLIGWEELTVAEAALVLGCTRTAAAVRLHRARRRLDELLGNRSAYATVPPSRKES